ncbi:hypothetical protein PPL_10315 [Heterostelium album PN500]|uniref:Uncharacterized protein n=1 Tax=Heterostelium pallidum (strain ATCC 26659 / Pp 5 / PN500) TaxID=670386 RepID=D3BPZ6_HETP5|nr:hypothetical protein PPL_10315 [Heterostelium album PN500]EFA76547.1 hypothetical protein PPL_10315 [Heterostelium album PN500]|eukprot:XP_020428679.1 hypothetical protein PPL_10315 [Heterostelium album PN500]
MEKERIELSTLALLCILLYKYYTLPTELRLHFQESNFQIGAYAKYVNDQRSSVNNNEIMNFQQFQNENLISITF